MPKEKKGKLTGANIPDLSSHKDFSVSKNRKRSLVTKTQDY